VARWGNAVLSPDGHLDRTALRRVVFADQAQLEELNEIVHPEVERLRDHLVDQARARGDRIVVCDIPLLFEKGMADRFDRILLVDAPRPIRLERLLHDRGLQTTEAMEIIAAQMPAELKRARADFIVENGGTLTQLERRVQDLWSSLMRAANGVRSVALS
jgi:dephospho-CoA kinase